MQIICCFRAGLLLLQDISSYPEEEAVKEIEAQIEEEDEIDLEEEVDEEPVVPHTGLPEILVVQENLEEKTQTENSRNESLQQKKVNETQSEVQAVVTTTPTPIVMQQVT